MTGPALPPTVIAQRYLVQRELGGGGMSTVYVAEDTKHGRKVAIKLARPDLPSALSASERFNREIEVTAQLTHPHILPLLDSGEEDGRTYYVMPFIEGESLRDRLAREGRASVGEALRIVREVAGALDYAHERGVVHRDIKPENILLSAGHAVVADFGIARATTAVSNGTTTHAGLVIGTPVYMSPEQAFGEEIDGRADLYALGCVLFEMLAGEPPYNGPAGAAMLARKLSGAPPALEALGPQVPEAVRALIVKALTVDIALRFQSGRQMAEALDAAASGFGAARETPDSAALGTPRDAIAVLPFVTTRSGAVGDEHLGDGISEELTGALSRLKGLRVIARTSAFAFRNSDLDVREIGRRLGVRWLVEGSVRRSGERLRVTAELIDATSGFELWSERFDRRAEDLFDIEDEIGTCVAASLVARLAPKPSAPVSTPTAPKLPAPTSFAAYEHYLKGRHYFALRTAEGFARSVEQLQAAVEADPAFAAAYAALADSLATMGLYGIAAPRDVMPRAMEAARCATDHGGATAEALAARACVSAVYEWDWAAAERGFDAALLANPQYAIAHQWRAMHCLVPRRRFAEARQALRRAREIDPLSLAIAVSVAAVYYYERDFARAAESAREALAFDERFSMGHYFLGLALERTGDGAGAIAALSRATELSPGVEVRAALAHAFAGAGEQDRARAHLDALAAEAGERYVSPVLLAQVALGLGESERAIGWLGDARAAHAADLMWLGVRPTFDPLRDEPAFRALLREIGLDD